MLEPLKPQTANVGRVAVWLFHPVVLASLVIHGLFLMIPAGSDPGLENAATDAATDAVATTNGQTSPTSASSPHSPPAIAAPTTPSAPPPLPGTTQLTPTAAPALVTRSTLPPAQPAPQAHAAIAARPTAATQVRGQAPRSQATAAPQAAGNLPQVVANGNPPPPTTRSTANSTMPTPNNAANTPAAPDGTADPNAASEPMTLATLIETSQGDAPDPLVDYFATLRADYRYRPELTDPKHQLKAAIAWYETLQPDVATSAELLASLDQTQTKPDDHLELVFEEYTLNLASPIITCLSPSPQTAVFGVAVNHSGGLVAEPELFGSTGYRGLNQAAAIAIAATVFPLTGETTVYRLEVEIDDNADTCMSPLSQIAQGEAN